MPNPMHCGAFAGGLFGTMVVWVVAILPKLDFNDVDNIWICVLVFCLAPYTFYSYWQLLVTDPGFLPIPEKGLSLCFSCNAINYQLPSSDTCRNNCAISKLICNALISSKLSDLTILPLWILWKQPSIVFCYGTLLPINYGVLKGWRKKINSVHGALSHRILLPKTDKSRLLIRYALTIS